MLSIKKAIVITALISSSHAGWLNSMFHTEGDSAPISNEIAEPGVHGEMIYHDSSVNIHDRESILKAEEVDLDKLREEFAGFQP